MQICIRHFLRKSINGNHGYNRKNNVSQRTANDVNRFKSKRLPVGVVERFRACFSM